MKGEYKTSLIILTVIVVVIVLSIAYFLLSPSQVPELTVVNKNFNGTHLEVKLALKTNTTIHPYAIQGVNCEIYEQWTKSNIRFGDSITLTMPVGNIEPDKNYHLKFLLICDEGKLPFAVDISYGTEGVDYETFGEWATTDMCIGDNITITMVFSCEWEPLRPIFRYRG